jgi:tripartite-type tricarboxylate transporter receptor subunit TctC
MKPLERGRLSKIGRAFPATVGSVDVGGLLTRRAFVGGFCSGLAGVGTMLPIATARATYPDRPVRIVVPFLPGGGADLIARLLSPYLQHSLGQPFVVENRAGAAGRIGTAVVAKSDPDGHVLLMTTESSLVIAPHIGVPLNYQPLKDFAPISLLTRNTVILVVHPSVPATTLNDYIALARGKPGQLFFASSGVGGPNHLAGEIFNRMAGVDIVHVPFPGTGGAIQAVVGNQVGAMWGFMAGLIPHIRSGAVRALAVGGKARSPALPDVPTVAESGLPGYEATSWIGLLAPAATPVIEVVWEAVNGALQDAAVRDILLRDGSEIVASRPEDFRAVIANDYAKYGKMADLLMSAK